MSFLANPVFIFVTAVIWAVMHVGGYMNFARRLKVEDPRANPYDVVFVFSCLLILVMITASVAEALNYTSFARPIATIAQ